MDPVKFSVENPVKVACAVILVILFGITALFDIPIQLTPTVDRPIISVTTRWTGASPQEIETEVVNRQEDQLKNVSNLEKMTSESREGEGSIRLEFPVGINKDIAFRDVSDKLRQVTGYPEEVDEPIVTSADTEMENIIAWMILSGEGDTDVAKLKTFVEEQVKPILERAGGVAEVPVYGGLDREIKVEVDAHVLASRGLTFRDVETALRRQNDNVSAGTISQGKLDYSYRTMGEFTQISDLEDTVIAYQPGGPVRVRDVARVIDGFKKPFAFVRSKGEYVIALPARKETGANVVRTMENLKEKIALVNREILAPKGLKLELTQVYDETNYIWSAIGLLVNNIWMGGLLTVLVLWIFLRDLGATGIIAVAIPISTIGTFLIIALLGRTMNIILLAGLAFAVGMVVDNANVVLENIDRHRSMGKSRLAAALEGTREVWGAVLAGSLTSMVVFLPVIFIREEVGQLFKDIAIAIASAVGISLLVAVFVVPPLAARFMKGADFHAPSEGHIPWYGRCVGNGVDRITRSIWNRVGLVLGLSGLSIVGSWLLMPPADYLPPGNENLVFGFLFTPPGYSMDEFKRMGLMVEEGDPNDPFDGARPAWEARMGTAEAAKLPPVTMAVGDPMDEKTLTVTPPPLENFFFVSFGGQAFMGCTSQDPNNVAPLVPLMNAAGGRIPGAFSFFTQTSLFGGGSSGNSVEIEIRGDHHHEVVAAAGAIFGSVMAAGFGYPNPSPANFQLGRPEVQLKPDREKAAKLGLDVRDVGFIIEACIDGAFIGEFNDRGDRVDIALSVSGTAAATLEQIGQIPISSPTGQIIPIASAIDLRRTTAPQQINHIEEMPSVRLDVRPKAGMALQAVMTELEQSVIAPLRAAGAIPPSIITSLAGTAGKLKQTQHALIGNYQGTVKQPNLFGMGVPSTMLLLVGLCVFSAGVAGVARGRRAVATTLVVGSVFIAAAFLILNPSFPLTLFQSRMFLALVVTYLLMAGLFESFLYPFVIIFSVPFGVVGGFAALQIVHYTSLRSVAAPDQQFDTLTMLGFVMLLGIVVNNAILIVHQAINFMREQKTSPHEAVVHSVRTRTRPILMTTLTTLVGLIPLCIMTGAGSELYRGLGSVLLGGLTVSTVFTLFVVPAVFTLVLDVLAWLRTAPEAVETREVRAAARSVPVQSSAEGG